MTGYDVYKRALALLGYSTPAGTVCTDDPLPRRAGEILTQLCADLNTPPPASLAGELECSESASDALCYGMAMLLALTEGDGERNRLFADVYNAKRGTAKGNTCCISDVLPYYGGG